MQDTILLITESVSHNYLHKKMSNEYPNNLAEFSSYDLGFGIFFLPTSAPPWLPLSPDCPRPGAECGYSAFIICSGQGNVLWCSSWLGLDPTFIFAMGTAIQWLPLETLFFQTFLWDQCISITPLDSITVLCGSSSSHSCYPVAQGQVGGSFTNAHRFLLLLRTTISISFNLMEERPK